MSLSKYTDEQLEQELAKRRVAKIKPHMVNEPLNTHAIKEACNEFIEFLYSDDYNEDDIDDYRNQIFEAALEMVYGHSVWDYVNEIIV